MKWHEKRTQEDFDSIKYVEVGGGIIAKVLFFTNNTCGFETEGGGTAVSKNSVLPATSAQYYSFTNKQ